MDIVVRGNNNEGGNNNVFREYRKGNWTIQETMVLIEAKKMDEERRMKRHGGGHGESSNTTSSSGGAGGGGINKPPAELRWKWVEDYCWRKGCLRSQTQCNDKWDNLMRDFKKIRDYEKKLGDDDRRSYWKLEKSERKERSLPSNMLNQLYDALVEAVERKGRSRMAVSGGGGGGGGGSSSGVVVVEDGSCPCPPQNILPFAIQHHHHHPVPVVLPPPPPPQPPPVFLPLPPPLPSPPPPPPQFALPLHQPLPSVDSDTSHEHSDSPSKRRRKGRRGEGTSTAVDSSGGGGGDGGGNIPQPIEEGAVGNAISRGATIIAEAIQASEERVERRHREVMGMHQRRLQIEENKAETNRQGINGLVDAVNKLANSILSLASRGTNNNNNNQTP